MTSEQLTSLLASDHGDLCRENGQKDAAVMVKHQINNLVYMQLFRLVKVYYFIIK